MVRRHFLNSLGLTSMGMSLPHINSNFSHFFLAKNEFNLKYAPHFGMFKNIAGDDLIDQLNYIADQGFTAFEDNNLKKRTIETQNKMAKVMEEEEFKWVSLLHTPFIGKILT